MSTDNQPVKPMSAEEWRWNLWEPKPKRPQEISWAVMEVEAYAQYLSDFKLRERDAELLEDLRGALKTACVMPAVDKSFQKGLQDGIIIAIEFIEKSSPELLSRSPRKAGGE